LHSLSSLSCLPRLTALSSLSCAGRASIPTAATSRSSTTSATQTSTAGGSHNLGTRVHLGSTIDEQFHHGGVAFRCGPHESGLRLGIFLGIHARSVIEQDTNRVQVAGPCRHH
jgi:hypothetical protein